MQAGVRARRRAVVVVALAGALVAFGTPPAVAAASAARGSAFGSFSHVTLLGAPAETREPTPLVVLPSSGSPSALRGSAPAGMVAYGDAVLFTSGALSVSTEGTTRGAGSVSSSARIDTLDVSGREPLAASRLESRCTASSDGVTGSTTITDGTLTAVDGDGRETVVALPTDPEPNTTLYGVIAGVGDIAYVLNEQVGQPDGSLTVYAAHLKLLGPGATGDVFLGQAECGVVDGDAPPTPTTPTSTVAAPIMSGARAAAAVTSEAPPAAAVSPPAIVAHPVIPARPAVDTVGAAATATAAGPATVPGEVGGGACGYSANVGISGEPQGVRGCGQGDDGPEIGRSPEVALPAPGGSAAPITAHDANGALAEFGTARIFAGRWPKSEDAAPPSGPITVSTGGTGQSGTVRSSVDIVASDPPDPKWPGGVGPGPIEADQLHSRCEANGSGPAGSLNLVNGRLTTTTDDRGRPKAVEPVPDRPPPNYERRGEITNVGDTFRVIFNEQIVSGNAITLNAVHLHLFGPLAVGELIIGQVRCSAPGSGSGVGTVAAGGSGPAPAGPATGTNPARTGFEVVSMVRLAMGLLLTGWCVTYWTRRRQPVCIRVKVSCREVGP